jgi:hypothetical protein
MRKLTKAQRATIAAFLSGSWSFHQATEGFFYKTPAGWSGGPYPTLQTAISAAANYSQLCESERKKYEDLIAAP